MPKINQTTPAQVFELYGHSLYLCGAIENRIKCMLRGAGGIIVFKPPKDQNLIPEMIDDGFKKLKEKDDKLLKQSLGNVWQSVLERIYEVPNAKDIRKAESEGEFAFKMNFHISSKGHLAAAKRRMSALIEYRNYLAHNFSAEYPLDTPDSCTKAFKTLTQKYEITKKAFEFFDKDFKLIRQVKQEFSQIQFEKLNLHEAKKAKD